MLSQFNNWPTQEVSKPWCFYWLHEILAQFENKTQKSRYNPSRKQKTTKILSKIQQYNHKGKHWSLRLSFPRYKSNLLNTKSTTSISYITLFKYSRTHSEFIGQSLFFNHRNSYVTESPISPHSDGRSYLMIIVDSFTHYVALTPDSHCNAFYAYIKHYEHWIATFWLSEILEQNLPTTN